MNNNKKATKRALLTSVMALVMCVVMLVGTTFAWFTDTASTAVNKIQAGNLDIQLVDKDGVELDSATALKWKTEDTGEVLWEPNCKYELEGFQIKNAGNLAVKYKVVLKATDITKTADGKSLLDVIDWTIKLGSENVTVTKEQVKNGLVNGVEILVDKVLAPKELSGVISVTGHMDANAGNDYQGLKIGGFGINVLATQASYEKDSKDNTYDQGATYPVSTADLLAHYGNDGSRMPAGVEIASRDGQGNVTVTLKDEEAFLYFTQVFDMEAARAARETALANGTATRYPGESVHNNYNIWYRAYGQVHVELACDVDLQNRMVTPFTECRTFDGEGHTIKNATVVGDGKSVGFFGNFDVTDVKMDNIHVKADGDQYAGVISGYNSNAISKVTVTNSTVTGGRHTGAIVGNCYVDLENCVVENCVISGQYKVGGLAGYVCRENGKALNIRNNTLTNVTVKGENLIFGKSDYVIGQVVGNWNALSGGECTGNTINNVTGATTVIGRVQPDVVDPQH